MKKVYVLWLSSGYDDLNHHWIGGIFETKGEARKQADIIEKESNRIKAEREEKYPGEDWEYEEGRTEEETNKYYKFLIFNQDYLEMHEPEILEIELNKVLPVK